MFILHASQVNGKRKLESLNAVGLDPSQRIGETLPQVNQFGISLHNFRTPGDLGQALSGAHQDHARRPYAGPKGAW